MASVMKIVVRAQDQASDVIDGIGDSARVAGSMIEDNLGKIGAVSAAGGAALEGFARSQQDTNATIGRMASRTGESEDSIRDMLDGMTDATFSTHDAAASMEVLSQRGIESRDEFERQLPMWDEFADATGKDMPQAIEEATRGLGAFGIPASEAEDHIDTITFLSEEMDVEMDVMGRRLGRVADEMDELGLGLDEGAAGIKVFTDRGMSSRDAMNEFRDAVKDSDGDMDQLLDNLGLTADEWEDYQEEVAGAEGMTAEFAEINNETMTPLQEMQANLENTMAKYGGLADAAGMAAPVLMAVGPVMRGVTMATRGVSAAMAFLAANPIVLVIAAVAALVAGLIWAWNNSETFRDVVTSVFDAVAAAGSWMWEKVLQPVWDALVGAFGWVSDQAEAFLVGWLLVMRRMQDGARAVVNPIIGFFNAVLGGAERVINGIGTAINRIPSFDVPSWVPGIGGATFGIPTVPTVSLGRIPTLHTGGQFHAPGGRGEGLALLADREHVTPAGGFDELVAELRSVRRLLEDGQVLEVDGQVLAKANRRATGRMQARTLDVRLA